MKNLASNNIDIFLLETDEIFDLMDKELKDHSERVAELSLKIARYLKEPVNELALYKAALYHDIGKLVIDSSILNKPVQLTEEEMNIVKMHAKYSAQVLSNNKENNEVIIGSLLHHENYDGTGYPFGYIGKNIPVIARIIRVADTFDALHSKRTYKEALIIDECIKVMEDSKNNYDKSILDILLNNIL